MRKFFVSVILVLPILFTGCVIQPINGGPENVVSLPTSSAGFDSGESEYVGGYTIKTLDPLYIRFSGVVEQQALEVVVDENGEISLLHIADPIKAAGITTSALEAEIERLYVEGGIYKNVSVNVTMTAKVFYVQGEINQPGQFPLSSGTTLLQAIAGARGPTAFANLRKVTIVRHGKVYTFDIKKLEKDPSLDVKIEAGDVIKVWQKMF
ncbi:SLBB domain-containing protein [Pontiellaceae bacterium B12227]|nr:SLBB domain-containing protein [Pontiellaceae bacterium B12227]